jgi:hypothetical protein
MVIAGFSTTGTHALPYNFSNAASVAFNPASPPPRRQPAACLSRSEGVACTWLGRRRYDSTCTHRADDATDHEHDACANEPPSWWRCAVSAEDEPRPDDDQGVPEYLCIAHETLCDEVCGGAPPGQTCERIQ